MDKSDKKPTLEVVPLKKEEEEVDLKDLRINSFWNTCGEKQDGFPCEVCPEEKVGHGWSIKSPKHHNCFWEYVRAKSFSDGFMNPLSQAETAKLLGCSPTSVHMIEKSAIEKLKKSPHFELLREYLTKDADQQEETDYSLPDTFVDPDEYGDE